MQLFKKILLVAGDDDRHELGLERAAALAKKSGATLTVARVQEGLPREMDILVPAMHPEALLDLAVREQSESLERLVAPVKSAEGQLTPKVLVGSPFVEIVREVQRDGYDLVMLSTGPKSSLREMLFGSLAVHLMRRCPCPVWVLKATGSNDQRGVLAAVDMDATPHRRALNLRVIELAAALARLEEVDLHIVHAQETSRERREKEASFRALLDECQAEGVRRWVYLLKGDPRKVLPYLASSQGIESLVMGMVQCGAMTRLIAGNTAEEVLKAADCSVLTVKPPEEARTPRAAAA